MAYPSPSVVLLSTEFRFTLTDYETRTLIGPEVKKTKATCSRKKLTETISNEMSTGSNSTDWVSQWYHPKAHTYDRCLPWTDLPDIGNSGIQPYPCPEEWEVRDRLVAGAIVSNTVNPVGLGIDETKCASEIWSRLIKWFKKQDEQRIYLAETALRHEVFDPTADNMELHEKKMRNLLKKVHNLGGTTMDAQFRRIIIFSMPPDWRQDIRTVPDTLSKDAFTYL
ncbi:hypothetical protein F5877DRAFT_72584 [Lentinula edodes]|nr:hypothetical protein F5877DRAFT_72584 [Lentinula edodes]